MATSTRARRPAAVLAASGAALGALILAGAAQASATSPSGTTNTSGASSPAGAYTFRTVNDQRDVTFNQLLGINRHGVIAGYFGSGAAGHPNKGYTVTPGYRQLNHHDENVPGSVQTQVTGLNDRGVTVGFWSGMNNANQVNDNFGFWARDGHYHTVNFPTRDNAQPPVNQLLGVNDHDIAVGFYTDAANNNHGYTYGLTDRRFSTVAVAGATSVTAAAINNAGDIAGSDVNAAGVTDGFLQHRGSTTTLAYPGASMTQALGVNDSDEVVGFYQLGSGSTATTHGFTWTPQFGFATVDDPNGIGTTTVNGVNANGDLVGFYTDAAGNVDGMLATPTRTVSRVTLTAQPVGRVNLLRTSGGLVVANLDVTGLAPGTSHAVDIQAGDCDVLAPAAVSFPAVTANGAGQTAGSELISSNALPRLKQAALMIHLGTDLADPVQDLPVACVNLTGWSGYQTNRPVIALAGQTGPISGRSVIRYDGVTQTLTAQVVVTGLVPFSQHAAHLHSGSCAAQGPVVHMLPDLVANRSGIAQETVTLTGVTSPPPASGWYLNVHLGASSQILNGAGQPTMLFQPLACGALTGH